VTFEFIMNVRLRERAKTTYVDGLWGGPGRGQILRVKWLTESGRVMGD